MLNNLQFCSQAINRVINKTHLTTNLMIKKMKVVQMSAITQFQKHHPHVNVKYY